MSFSSSTKEDLSKLNNLNKKKQVNREIIGYLISSNTVKNGVKIRFSTENEYNINRFAKLLKNCSLDDFKIEIKGKVYSIELKFQNSFEELVFESNRIFFKPNVEDEELDKAIVRGAFLGSGYISNPEKKYHLELNFVEQQNLDCIIRLLKKYNIKMKKMDKEKSCSLYIKDGEKISEFLAFIGATKSVLKFEEIRVVRDTKNNVNRLINCETANLSKTIEAGRRQIEDIKVIKSKKKFSELPESLQVVANIRVEHPDASLSELVGLMDGKISKSGLSHRFTAISKFADEIREQGN